MIRCRRLLAILAVLFCAAWVLPQDVKSSEPPTTVEIEKRLFEMANQVRREAGVPELKWDSHLAVAARLHANEMAKDKSLSHQLANEPSLSQRLGAQGAKFDAAAENIGFADNFEDVHAGWVDSPPHHANMVSSHYDIAGVGVARVNDRIYAATDFAHLLPSYGEQKAQEAVIEAIAKLRRSHGMPALAGTATAALNSQACTDRNSADAAATTASGPFRSQLQYNYTTSDLSRLPDKLAADLLSPGLKSFVLGQCQRKDPDQGFSVYRVLMVLYH